MRTRFPGAYWSPIPGCPGLGWADTTDQRRSLLHRTEGSTIAGAEGAYRANRSAPHLTVDIKRRQIHQHVQMDRGGYSLRNGPDPIQTNRDRHTWQTEIVGYSETDNATLTPADLEWFRTAVVVPFTEIYDVPAVALEMHPYPPPPPHRLGSEPWRLTRTQWLAFSGWLGHQHAPDGNFHGDPGLFPIDQLITPNGALMPEEADALNARIDRLVKVIEMYVIWTKNVTNALKLGHELQDDELENLEAELAKLGGR